jgi:hypothetical protein
MSMMLDIAGGIVIAAVIIGLFKTGIECVISRGQYGDGDFRAVGWLALAVAAAAAFWLVFVRTGAVPL